MQEEAAIFQFVLNGKPVYVDPLRPYWAMHDDKEFQKALAEAKLDADPEAAREATRKVVAWTRTNLKLPDIDPETGNGMTDLEVMRVLGDFLKFVQGTQNAEV